jgi:hypothetical protein
VDRAGTVYRAHPLTWLTGHTVAYATYPERRVRDVHDAVGHSQGQVRHRPE